jgi:hypothetical protein
MSIKPPPVAAAIYDAASSQHPPSNTEDRTSISVHVPAGVSQNRAGGAPSDIDSQSRRPSERERTSQTSYEPVSRNIPNSHSVEKRYDFASCKTWQLARARANFAVFDQIFFGAPRLTFSLFRCAQLLWSVGSDSGRNCQTLARRRGGAKSK